MTRTARSARTAGTRFERDIADYLAAQLGDDRIDRRVKTGAADRGDIGGVRTAAGDRVVIECKDTARVALSGWVTEAQTEATNDGAVAGVVIAKRRGHGLPGSQYVVCTVDDLIALLRSGAEARS